MTELNRRSWLIAKLSFLLVGYPALVVAALIANTDTKPMAAAEILSLTIAFIVGSIILSSIMGTLYAAAIMLFACNAYTAVTVKIVE